MKYDIGIDLCRILFSQLREDSNLNSFHKGELYKIGILKKKKKKKNHGNITKPRDSLTLYKIKSVQFYQM